MTCPKCGSGEWKELRQFREYPKIIADYFGTLEVARLCECKGCGYQFYGVSQYEWSNFKWLWELHGLNPDEEVLCQADELHIAGEIIRTYLAKLDRMREGFDADSEMYKQLTDAISDIDGARRSMFKSILSNDEKIKKINEGE